MDFSKPQATSRVPSKRNERPFWNETDRESLAMQSLGFAVLAIVLVWLNGIAHVAVGAWQWLGPEWGSGLYAFTDRMGLALFFLGLFACCVSAVVGTWPYRVATFIVGLAFAPLIPTYFGWLWHHYGESLIHRLFAA